MTIRQDGSSYSRSNLVCWHGKRGGEMTKMGQGVESKAEMKTIEEPDTYLFSDLWFDLFNSDT